MNIHHAISRRQFLTTLLAAGTAAAADWSAAGLLAAQTQKKEAFPVVVIGSGLGGLVSAAYLARYGFPVTVIEQHGIPGGYATSFDREQGRFTFDVSLHATVAEHGMPQKILSDLGIWDQLEVVYAPDLRRIITPAFDVTLPAKNPEGVKQALSKVFPHEKKGIHQFYSEMEQVIHELWRTRTYQKSMMKTLSSKTLAQWMAGHVTDPGGKHCMGIFCGYYGAGPEKTNALFYAIATGEYLVHGGQYYKTRSQNLSDALARAVEEHSGRVIYNTRAAAVVFDSDHQVAAVRDDSGRHYPAKAVIANCPVPVLFRSMIPEELVPREYHETINQPPSESSFVVWLGLNREITDQIRDYEISIHREGDSGDPAAHGFGVTVYDNLFKGYSVPGTSTMTIISLAGYDHWKPYEADYFNGNKDAYNKEKQRIAAAYVRYLEQTLIPGLSDMIQVMEIGTPLTNIRYTGNPGGAIYGFRGATGHLDVKTPVPGIYLAGAWADGGGYTPAMISGQKASLAVLKDCQS